jgi:hypothetical protein
MRKLAAAALAVIVGCGGHPAPEPLVPPPAEPPPMSTEPHEAVIVGPLPRSIAMPRPAPRTPPDLDALARWPLGFNEHPEDEPSFDIAGALADPGVTWRDLCRRGVQFGHRAHDQDLIAYLKAWCTEDTDDALYQLGLLQSSAIHGIADAVAPDAARRLVHVSAATAEGTLMRAHVTSPHVFDLLAASYYEVGKLDEAIAMNKNSISGADADEAATCHRLAHGIAISTGPEQAQLAELLYRYAHPFTTDAVGAHAVAPNSTCVALDEDVGCWVEVKACAFGTKLETRFLQRAIASWPSYATTFSEWSDEYDAARAALPAPYAITLAVAALQAELRTSECEQKRLAGLLDATTIMRTAVTRGDDLDRQLDEIDEIAKLPTVQCMHALGAR